MKTSKFTGFGSISLIVISFLFNSCATTSKLTENDLIGIYVQKDHHLIELQLKKDSFVLIDHSSEYAEMPIFDCCDTITYGKWKKDKHLPLLIMSNGNYLIYDSDFPLSSTIVKEKIIPGDSIVFRITSPLEDYYKREHRNAKGLTYQIDAISSRYESIITKKTTDNLIILNTRKIIFFDLVVIPNEDINLRHLEVRHLVLFYDVKNTKANMFEINIPQLNHDFLSYKRLKDDYVRIINKNKLLWDGEIYIKKK